MVITTLGGNMIPAYPTNTEPMVVLGSKSYLLNAVDFIMYEDETASYGIAAVPNEDEGSYKAMVSADEWKVVLNDDSVITVLQSELDSDTREHLLNLAFPG